MLGSAEQKNKQTNLLTKKQKIGVLGLEQLGRLIPSHSILEGAVIKLYRVGSLQCIDLIKTG